MIVYLPPGYESDKNKRYPVFYMHDGQNLFDGATSFIPGKEWRVDETAEADCGRTDRAAHHCRYLQRLKIELMNTLRPGREIQGRRQGDLYGRMLVEELKPFIDSTIGRRMPRTLALAVPHWADCFALSRSEVSPYIQEAALVSPSVWFANKQIVHYAEALTETGRSHLDRHRRERRAHCGSATVRHGRPAPERNTYEKGLESWERLELYGGRKRRTQRDRLGSASRADTQFPFSAIRC